MKGGGVGYVDQFVDKGRREELKSKEVTIARNR